MADDTCLACSVLQLKSKRELESDDTCLVCTWLAGTRVLSSRLPVSRLLMLEFAFTLPLQNVEIRLLMLGLLLSPHFLFFCLSFPGGSSAQLPVYARMFASRMRSCRFSKRAVLHVALRYVTLRVLQGSYWSRIVTGKGDCTGLAR